MKKRKKQDLFAGLDVGSSKISCFIALRDEADTNPRVIGIGTQLSRGMKNGVITDLSEVENSILNAVNRAEEMAGEKIDTVIASLNGAGLKSHYKETLIDIEGEVQDQDLKRVMEEGDIQYVNGVSHQTIHSFPIGFSVDECAGIRDPRGMFGSKLEASLHAVTARQASCQNLKQCIERCFLNVAGFVAAPYASGLSVLVEDELDLGSVVIDMGGGTTSYAVFEAGELVFIGCVPVGGQHVSNDIAAGLATPLGDAERLKTLYGSALEGPREITEMMDVPVMGDHDHIQSVPKSYLVDIIRPRVEETLELVKQRLQESGIYAHGSHRIVLTGGAAQLTGARELAHMVFGKPVRLGKPLKIAGLADAVNGPAYATCAGLLNYQFRSGDFYAGHMYQKPMGFFDRLSHWLQVG